MNMKTKIVLGVIGAAAVGAVIGMLVAPEKGEDLRQKIKDKSKGLGDDLADWFKDAKEQLTNLTEKVEKEVNDLRGEVRGKADDLRNKAEDFKSKGEDLRNNAVRSAEQKIS